MFAPSERRLPSYHRRTTRSTRCGSDDFFALARSRLRLGGAGARTAGCADEGGTGEFLRSPCGAPYTRARSDGRRRGADPLEVIGRQWEQERVDRFLDVLAGGPPPSFSRVIRGSARRPSGARAVDAARVAPIAFSSAGRLNRRRALVSRPRRSPRKRVRRGRRASSRAAASGAGVRACAIGGRGFAGSRQRGARRARRASSFGGRGADGARDRRRAVARPATRPMFSASSRIDSPTSGSDSWCPCATVERALSSSIMPSLGVGSSDYGSSRSRSRSSKRSYGCILPVSFTRPTWRALHRISGGNPFFALQLAEALERRGRQSPGEELPIPETLADAMRERLSALSPSARAALVPVAALAQPTLP